MHTHNKWREDYRWTASSYMQVCQHDYFSLNRIEHCFVSDAGSQQTLAEINSFWAIWADNKFPFN